MSTGKTPAERVESGIEARPPEIHRCFAVSDVISEIVQGRIVNSWRLYTVVSNPPLVVRQPVCGRTDMDFPVAYIRFYFPEEMRVKVRRLGNRGPAAIRPGSGWGAGLPVFEANATEAGYLETSQKQVPNYTLGQRTGPKSSFKQRSAPQCFPDGLC